MAAVATAHVVVLLDDECEDVTEILEAQVVTILIRIPYLFIEGLIYVKLQKFQFHWERPFESGRDNITEVFLVVEDLGRDIQDELFDGCKESGRFVVIKEDE
ncbi:hypothetical protein WICPIJ_004554 [Wickerhamomyces pijperi]|uniref:Uncharacterized protein n=1 Tax=Wickerhamomyces pijperi TaxID=599730 RepID=A0A9P8Q7M5_WICPI|nr:hypothetical protein WICPIJ_004554 [Wickerhamomyces pijperi]